MNYRSVLEWTATAGLLRSKRCTKMWPRPLAQKYQCEAITALTSLCDVYICKNFSGNL